MVEKHPNADTLSITRVYDYPVIFKTGELQPGDFAIYFPVDALLPNRKEFSFIWKGKENPTDKQRVVRAIRLRGIFSMGLLMPVSLFPETSNTGSELGDVSEILGVVKWDPPLPVSMGGQNRKDPGWFPRYTDIENIRKYGEVLVPGEPVIITEKIHGTNARYAYKDGGLWVGSHNLVKETDDNNIYSRIAKEYALIQRLDAAGLDNVVLFGEIYGGAVQKGFDYGLKDPKLILFDIFSLEEGKYLDWFDFVECAEKLGLPVVPVINKNGIFTSIYDIMQLAEGPSVMPGAKHVREGFVLKPYKERWDYKVGRVILKVHGEGYLLSRGKKKERGH
jgi:RNA ligase (TIGR02306 family)